MRMKKIQHTPDTCPGKPCGIDCDHAETRYDPEHVTRIDRHNYPAIHRGCIDILVDNGALNAVEQDLDAARTVILLPVHPASGFGLMEAAVFTLASGDTWDIFFFGETTDSLEIAASDADLAHLYVILNLWFEIGMPIETR